MVYSDEVEKANIFNDYFRDQTLLDEDNVTRPAIDNYIVNEPVSSLVFTTDEVKAILRTLPVGKAVGPDGISNRILRELANELSTPLATLFNQSVHQGEVPIRFKIAHVCPVPKGGGDASNVCNYRPISLLSNLDKVFERLVFKHLFNQLRDNNILTSFQSGFIPGDSTTNQLTFLYNTFCQALDAGKEVRAVFCDISKAFDRVWHAGLLHKLKSIGLSGDLLKWFSSYLDGRKQRVVLQGVESKWNYIKADVPQGSILGPLLFLIFIIDIVTEIGSSIRHFADDTSLFITVNNPDVAAEILNADLEKIAKWAEAWLVKFNPLKTETLLISRKINKPVHPSLIMLGQQIKEVEFHKHLGIYFSNDGSWHKHIDYIKEKAWTRINIMRRLKYVLDRKSLEIIYTTFIRPILQYADVIWDNCCDYEKRELEKIQIETARVASGTTKLISIQNLYKEIGWETLEKRRINHNLILFYKIYNNLTPDYLSSLVPSSVNERSRYNLRNANDVQTINARTALYFNSFLPSVIREWNTLSENNKYVDSINSFKRQISRNKTAVPKYIYTGSRKLQILHTRLRTGCSSLNHDLFAKSISDTPLCSCRSGDVENAEHFFLSCNFYRDHRIELYRIVSQYCNASLHVFLHGDESLPYETNQVIFEAVYKYIQNSKRF